ncbi:hypothetical protein ACFP9V_07565 [Deinococcus radiopugnans]|uniref:Uncharacterized protein n=1 Tax=Deinococcus radiopugnans ATCC 19172 TaxID=585398 RepID=A0A5C4Y4X3_9DEIO|nr:hypothetical protein [Deinococcus radiopugnans]MBB6017240.1 hypothetical protein [Deinococcus radiopugnans ATCC 19172]TNM70554.1 hypothetical protein FHR04_12890 [Deinococcus radiopugnans ATCC 19172]
MVQKTMRKGNPEKLAAAYQYQGKILLHAYSQTTAGVWISENNVTEYTDEELSTAAIASILSTSTAGIGHPENWDGLFDSVIQMADVRSWESFVLGRKYVGISQIGEVIEFTPSRNMGSEEGFLPRLECATRADCNSPLLHLKLLKAFELSE